MTHLPHLHSVEEYRAVYEHDTVWLPAIGAIAQRHSLVGIPERLTLGTHIVYGVDDTIVKLFSPFWPEDYNSEQASLASLADLPTPQVLEKGDLEGWPYLILSRVAGEPVAQVWRTLSRDDRRSLAGQIGVLLRQLHNQELPEGLDHDWEGFLATRLRQVEAHHAAEEPWKSWIRSALADFEEPALSPVLLHADLTADHFFVHLQDGGCWSISSIIDFGDARIGHPFYDFVAVFADFTLGEPELTRSLLEGYGLDRHEAMSQDLIRYCFLHEFWNLADFQRLVPMEGPDEFHRALFG